MFHRRPIDPDAKEALKRIPILASIIPQPDPDDEDNQPKKIPMDNMGFLFLSRLNKDEGESTKVREKQNKSVEQEDSVLTEAKSLESAQSVVFNSEKNRRYALSLATLATKPHKRLFIVDEGAIGVLVELAAHHDKLIQVRCASAFASLTVEPTVRPRMLEEGALGMISSLAQNSNIREIKSDCCKAICNLCSVAGYEHKLAKESVPFTVMNIALAVPETHYISLMALVNLSCVPEKYTRIEDVTEALLFFFNQPTLTVDQEILLLQGFCNLSALRGNQIRLVEEGALKIIEKHYKSKNTELRRMAIEMLKNFTTDSKARLKLLEIDIMRIVLEMSKDPDEDIQVQVAKCFLFLAKDATFRRKIIESEAFVLILETSRAVTMKVELGRVSAKTLKVLCEDKNLAPKLIEDGIGVALVYLMGSNDEVIQHYCTESFCALFQVVESLPTLIAQNAHETIVNLANNAKDSLTLEWCSFALYQLTESKACSYRCMETLVLPCILKLSAEGSPLTKAFCAGALAHATMTTKLDFRDSIPMLISMLNESSLELVDVKRYCAQALFNLAKSDANCKIMLTGDVLTPVVELTQYKETKVICAGIISRLSLHPQFYDKFSQGNVLKVLLELSRVDDRLTQRRVVVALSNLSQNEYLRSKLLELNPIAYIVALASERDEYLRRGCISIVCNMSYLEGSEKAIVNAGVIRTLMITSMITTDQVESRIICVKALVNLMSDRSLYQGMVDEGIIWSLSKLALIDNPELIGLCAMALCRLSVEFSRHMISSPVTVRTILSLLHRDEMQLKKATARCMTNMLLETTENDDSFRKLVVENMHSIASTHDEELNELCVICLCMASQSEECRTAIVKREMINKIVASAIFSTDPTISFAYITMVSNIANNEEMRPKILDGQLIAKFQRILENKDPKLTLAVAKALYCISCSLDNIPKLVAQNILPFLENNFDFSDEGSPSIPALNSHLIACLYNLTVDPSVHHTLVSAGVVQLLVKTWPEARKDQKICTLVMLAITHLACGKTNSARMVDEGCTTILNFVQLAVTTPGYTNYKFGINENLRVSAAFRNLLTVVGNQRRMIEDGCLPVLIKLANYSPYRTQGVTTASLTSTSSSIGSMATSQEVKVVRSNSTAALKSLTYNADMRNTLLQGDAMNIIMAEIRKESDLSMSASLLKELEAESWENGGRGKLKDGRSRGSSVTHGIFSDLLKGVTDDVRLNVSKKDVELKKCFVSVQLEDASANGGGSGASSTANSPTRVRGSKTSVDLTNNANSASNKSSPAHASSRGRSNTLDSTSNANASDQSSMGGGSSSNGNPGGGAGGGGGGESPGVLKSTPSSKQLRLQRMASAASLITQPLENLQQNQVLSLDSNNINFLNDGNLSIQRLTMKEDGDDAMGLVPMRYAKRECEVYTDPKTLMDQVDDLLPSSTSSLNNNQQGSANNLLQRETDEISTARSMPGQQNSWRSISTNGIQSTRSSYELKNTARSSNPSDNHGTNSGQRSTRSNLDVQMLNSADGSLYMDAGSVLSMSPPMSPGSGRQHQQHSGRQHHHAHSQQQHQQFDYFPGAPSYQQQQMQQYKEQQAWKLQQDKNLRGSLQLHNPQPALSPIQSANHNKSSGRSSSRQQLAHGQQNHFPGSSSQRLPRSAGSHTQLPDGRGRRHQTNSASAARLSPLRLTGDIIAHQKTGKGASTSAVEVPDDEEQIMSLVAMIKKAKELQDRDASYGLKNRGDVQESRVGELLDKWKAISRF